MPVRPRTALALEVFALRRQLVVLRRRAPARQRLRRRDEVEQRVLKTLTENLLRQELFEEFCEEFTREMNRFVRELVAGAGRATRPR
jgi:hypothetical protein